MPVYEVKCVKCDKIDTVLVSTMTNKIKCPICGEEVEKLISSVNFKIKGYNYKNNYEGESNESN